MKRTIVLVAALLLASALPTPAQTTDNTMLLLQRVAAQNSGGQVEVFVGKLPTDMPKTLLPDASLIGSLHRIAQRQNSHAVDSYDLFYDAPPQVVSTYQSALTAAGWTNRQMPMMNSGGFVPSKGPDFAFYCKANAPLITIRTDAQRGDLLVSVVPPSESADVVCGGPEATGRMIASAMQSATQSALPPLHAPSGTSMTIGQPGIQTGPSGAYISGASSAQSLLDNFAAQMRAAGWQAGATSTGATLVSQTFHFVDTAKTAWQCVITVYAVDGRPGDYIAFIDATNLTTLGNNSFHSAIIKSP